MRELEKKESFKSQVQWNEYKLLNSKKPKEYNQASKPPFGYATCLANNQRPDIGPTPTFIVTRVVVRLVLGMPPAGLVGHLAQIIYNFACFYVSLPH